MTPRESVGSRPAPTPRALLLLPALVILAAAFLTPNSELSSNQGDIGLYLEKARALAAGLVPYRDFPFEYPPLALLPMALPYLAWPFVEITLESYHWLFAAWQAGLMLVLAFVLTRIVRLGGDAAADAATPDRLGTRGRLRRVALQLFLLSIGAALALTFRFDLFPAVLVMAAVWAALANRPVIAGVAIALGILAKLYPLAVVPALAIPWLVPFDHRRLVRFGAATVLTTAVVLAPFVALAGDVTFAFLRYQADRGLQIESVGGGLAVLVGLLTGNPPAESYGFSSVQVEGPLAATWLALLPAATILGFGLLGLFGWRRIRREVADEGSVPASTVVLIATAAILVLLVTSKVFSIQYVVWIVALAALLQGRRFWLAAAAVALTMPIHPLLYHDLVEQGALPILVLNLRNLMVVALAAWVLRDVAGGSSTRALPRPTSTRSG